MLIFFPLAQLVTLKLWVNFKVNPISTFGEDISIKLLLGPFCSLNTPNTNIHSKHGLNRAITAM